MPHGSDIYLPVIICICPGGGLKLTNMKIARRITALLILLALVPAACNSIEPAARANSPAILDQLSKNKSVTVSLSGLTTFNNHGQNVTSFQEFGVKDVPLMWMDSTFMGNVTISAPGKQVVDHVHGVATHDGRFLEHLSYWREIKEDGKPDVIIDITVYAIPMDGSVGNSTLAECFVKTGDVKKYVLDFTYIEDGVTYVCTDWTNVQQPPVLNIQFSK